MNGESFRGFLAAVRPEIEAELERRLPGGATAPRRLHEAMRYSVFAGGKRLRPALVVLAGESCGATRERLLAGAAAIEMIHTYSLIHDDLPALDDDDLRRGRPTLHRMYDEATAILAGDALLTHGLGLLAAAPAAVDAATRARATALVAEAIGTGGMIGGQEEDLEAERRWPADAEAALERIHLGKTAALLGASLRLGGVYGGAGEDVDRALVGLGRAVGLMFQVADDILDVEGSARELGKTPGKDAEAKKLTYPVLHGLAASRERVAQLAAEARVQIARLPGNPPTFHSLIDYLVARDR
ncbi:MAG: farnesyl diphosphate synthase [Thermoanaerobaculia bacterium]